ncbi:juvenile hormone esterase-like [Cydia strobilella]|uniref:juvenile hormone esterase-like n=1 Tax=Cydia strobilella TaxID=1100964 RepID=UPI0030063A01
MANPVVDINEGKIRGYEKKINNKVYYGFKGIPYAKPPIGELRFRVPEPPEQWEGVRDGTTDCNICIQFDKMSKAVVGSEDCLFLNVFAPSLPEAGGPRALPVMVFIHGGGFMFGCGTDPSHLGPDWLVEQDVVMVSLNYRLGILGFLNLDRPDAPGNMGLRDQVQALKWVQKNISKFGGDHNNVTIFGVSAGGSSVEYLLLSPMAKGLFHKAIMQSGSTLLNWAINKNMREIIKNLPQMKDNNNTNDDELIQILKSLSGKDLIMASMTALEATKRKGGLYFGFVPSVEKPSGWEPFLDKSPLDLLSRSEFTRVPVMTGFCARENILLRFYAPHLLEKLKQDKIFLDHLPFEIDNGLKAEVENKLKKIYLEAENRYGEDDEYAIDFFSDVDFIAGIYISATLISKRNPSVYLYEFAYSGKLNYLKVKLGITSPGACHGDDSGYIQPSAVVPTNNISDTDKTVRDRMVMLFTNFAKYGDPTPVVDNLITTKWEPLGPSGRSLFIDDQLTMQAFPYTARTALFEQLYNGQYGPKCHC